MLKSKTSKKFYICDVVFGFSDQEIYSMEGPRKPQNFVASIKNNELSVLQWFGQLDPLI